MRVLVTGAKGFVGKNLCLALKEQGHEVYEYDIDCNKMALAQFTKDCEFVFHLAGINRPTDNDYSGNYTLLEDVLHFLKLNFNKCPVMLSSSIQVEKDNAYGKSKLKAEMILTNYGLEYDVKTFIYRFPNIFGPGCRPNYNSVVATWCYNLPRKKPVVIDSSATIRLIYICDVVNELLHLLETNKKGDYEYNIVCVMLDGLESILEDIALSVKTGRMIPSGDKFYKDLYTTYLYYLDDPAILLTTNADNRGSFTELYKSDSNGQVSVNVIKPGITKGNHYHHNKWEQFTVVAGRCVIEERNVYSNEKLSYYVDASEAIKSFYMLPGWTHNIMNIGKENAVVVMYANEEFDPDKPDTYYCEV